MGKRGRRKGKAAPENGPAKTVDYTDPDGNMLTLRERVSKASAVTMRFSKTGGRHPPWTISGAAAPSSCLSASW